MHYSSVNSTATFCLHYSSHHWYRNILPFTLFFSHWYRNTLSSNYSSVIGIATICLCTFFSHTVTFNLHYSLVVGTPTFWFCNLLHSYRNILSLYYSSVIGTATFCLSTILQSLILTVFCENLCLVTNCVLPEIFRLKWKNCSNGCIYLCDCVNIFA